MPIFIETVMPVWTTIAVCLVITFAVHIFEDVRTWFIFLSGRSICFLVLHTTPCFLSVVFGHMSFIALGTPKDMRATTKCRMSPLPTVLALQNTWVHIVPLIVAMKRPMLKQQFMMFFAKEPLWESQMSNQTTTMSDLEDALMTRGFEANAIPLKRWVSLRTSSIKSEEIMF